MSWLWIAAAVVAVFYVLGTVALEQQAEAARKEGRDQEGSS